jgi:hypothetical protein
VALPTTFWEQLPDVLRQLCQSEHCEFHDFSDPKAAGISDDQFIDWLHAADTTYVGMLIEIVQRNAESVLARRWIFTVISPPGAVC